MAKLHQRRRQYTNVRYSTPKPTQANPTPTPYVSGGATSESSDTGFNLSTPSGFGGSPGTVIVLGTTLLIAVTWEDFWKPFFISLFNVTPFQPPQSWNIMIGGFIAVGIAAIFAAQGEDIAGVISLALIAMWLVFITMSGSPVIKQFVDFFTKGTGSGNLNAPTGQVSMKVPNPSSSSSPKLTTL